MFPKIIELAKKLKGFLLLVAILVLIIGCLIIAALNPNKLSGLQLFLIIMFLILLLLVALLFAYKYVKVNGSVGAIDPELRMLAKKFLALDQ